MQNPLLFRILQSLDENGGLNNDNNMKNEDIAFPSNSTYRYTLSSLTPSMESFLNKQFYQRPFITPQFDLEDLDCLQGTTWIDDAVLNSYLSICFNKINEQDERKIGLTNTFFMSIIDRDGFQAASRWQGIKGEPVNKYDLFFIPIRCGLHWILAVMDFIHNEIQIYDSLHGQYSCVIKILNDFLAFQGIKPLHATYPNVPTQHNGYDCGVFVMEFGRCLFLGQDINSFSQRDIPRARERIYSELLSYYRTKKI